MDATVEGPKSQRDAGVAFFGGVLSDEERRLLPDAYDLEGLEHEMALLRVKLRSAIAADPANHRLMLMGVNTLARMAAVRYRISPKVRKDLADNMTALLNSIGDLILPPG